MTHSLRRRRVLCIRPRINHQAGVILTVTSNEWVEALRLQAEVIEIEDDFDLQAVGDDVRPDLMILDAVNWTRPWPLRIAHPRSHPDIPRVLYLNSDPHDPMRALTMRMADALGIEAVFTTSETYFQNMPELRHKQRFMLPQFVDTSVYRDYGLPKSIPISVFGGHFIKDFYAWRAEAVHALEGMLPTLIYTHPGYEKGRQSPFAVFGESYARLLNRSRFSLADTTRCDYLVRKHLEIPGAGCVLVAPPSRALALYGFVDGENCILGSGPDLVRKIAAVEGDPDRYEAIRLAGLSLIETRYTRERWTFFLDWLDRHSALAPGQAVEQAVAYGPFSIVSEDAAQPLQIAPRGNNQLAAALDDTRSAILAGTDLAGAEARIAEVAGWLAHVGEPFFMAGVIALMRGDAASAACLIARRADSQAQIDPSLRTLDPVEIAWLLLIAHATGNPSAIAKLRDEAAGLDHLALRRVFWLLDGGTAEVGPDLLERRDTDLVSVHWLGEEDFALWSRLVTRILSAAANRMHATGQPFALASVA